MTMISPPIVGEGTIAQWTEAASRPRTLYDLGPIFFVGGFVLLLAGFTDLALFYLRPKFGDAAWEFATVAQTFDAMPLPMIGLVLLALGARAGRSVAWSRALAVAFALVSVVTAVLLTVLAFDVPVAIEALRPSTQVSDEWSATVAYGLWRSVSKALLFGACYALSTALLARIMWKGAKQIERG